MVANIQTSVRFPFFSFEEIAPWLTENLNPQQVEDFLAHCGLYNQIVPTQPWQLMLIQAALIIKLHKERRTDQSSRSFFVSNEILSFSRSLAEAVSIFLNGCEPCGISQIYLKEGDSDMLLATSIAFEGKIGFSKKEKIAEVEVDFGLKEKQKITVLSDEIILIPQSFENKTKMKISTFGKVEIEGTKKKLFEVQSGKVGIVIDGRGRPIVPPTPDEEGRKRLLSWKEVFMKEF